APATASCSSPRSRSTTGARRCSTFRDSSGRPWSSTATSSASRCRSSPARPTPRAGRRERAPQSAPPAGGAGPVPAGPAPAAGSLQALHVYFPDPWWKKRHHKRRLFTPEFVAECARVLRPGGRMHFVSDVEDYFRTADGLLASQPLLRPTAPPQPGDPRHDLD